MAGERARITLPFPALIAATPDLALGATFLLAWIMPGVLGPGLATRLVAVMLLEFIIIHSSAFMGVALFRPGIRADRVKAVVGIGLFYTLFVAGFSLALHTAWPLVSFWSLTANRLLSVLVGQAPGGEEQAFIRRGWAASAIFYLGFTMLTVVLPVPRFGLTPEVVSRLRLPGSGLWIEQPWRVLALGFLYFSAVGISELYGHRWAASGTKSLPPV